MGSNDVYNKDVMSKHLANGGKIADALTNKFRYATFRERGKINDAYIQENDAEYVNRILNDTSLLSSTTLIDKEYEMLLADAADKAKRLGKVLGDSSVGKASIKPSLDKQVQERIQEVKAASAKFYSKIKKKK